MSMLMILTMQAGVGVERCIAHQQGVGGNLSNVKYFGIPMIKNYFAVFQEQREKLQPLNLFLIITITICIGSDRTKFYTFETVRSY